MAAVSPLRVGDMAHYSLDLARGRSLGDLCSPEEGGRSWILGSAAELLLLPQCVDCPSLWTSSYRDLAAKGIGLVGPFRCGYSVRAAHKRSFGDQDRGIGV